MGQHDLGRLPAHPLTRGADHPAQQARGQRLRGERRAGDHDRYVVTDPAFELAGEPIGLGQPAPLGHLADQELPVGLEEQYRRDLERAVAQTDDGGLSHAVRDGRGGEGGTEVNSQSVRHAGPPVEGVRWPPAAATRTMGAPAASGKAWAHHT